jgi:hypothetical protein
MKPKQDPCGLPVSITRVWKADDWTFLAILPADGQELDKEAMLLLEACMSGAMQ